MFFQLFRSALLFLPSECKVETLRLFVFHVCWYFRCWKAWQQNHSFCRKPCQPQPKVPFSTTTLPGAELHLASRLAKPSQPDVYVCLLRTPPYKRLFNRSFEDWPIPWHQSAPPLPWQKRPVDISWKAGANMATRVVPMTQAFSPARSGISEDFWWFRMK